MRFYLIAPQSNGHAEFTRQSLSAGRGGRVTRVAAAAITTVAALVPSDFDISLCDEAIQQVDFDVDAVIGLSVNVTQALRGLEIADNFRARGRTVVMGGPHVSLAPELFEGRADALVIGEFEPIANEFFSDLRAGALKPRYRGGKADMTQSPLPRWDLYPNELAVSGVVQTSRGCPFECNFCDVIQYLGRVQRHKDNAQVVSEVQTLYDLGYSMIGLADDNFTVYRKRTKSLLKALAEWNGKDGRDYVSFATQMSIDVARDDEILALCYEAALLNAYVGIETSNQDSLAESKKRQNLHVDLAEACRKVVRAGIRLEAGLMVGFDHDDQTCFERQFDFAMTLPVSAFNVTVLVAPAATPLFEELRVQGRIVSDEVLAQFPSANLITNFEPAQMTRDELYVGAKWLINKLLDPDNFELRLESMLDMLVPPPWERNGDGRRRRPLARAKPVALFSRVLQDLTRRDRRIAGLVRRTFDRMRKRPEIREVLGDALTYYLMTLRGYEIEGVYERGWAALAAPPFGIATADERLSHIRACEMN
jgi:radical SAM superfamily enzyme YgiQ (UPF0313 family)